MIGMITLALGAAPARAAENDSLVTSFGGFGMGSIVVDAPLQINAMALQGDGKIIAVGVADNSFAVARYLASGAPDASFDLYGGVDQQVQHTPAEMTTMTCANQWAPLPTPIGLKNIVPNYSRTVLADYLQARMVKVCVGGEWLDPITSPCRVFPCPTFAFHRAKISVYVGTTLVARYSSDTAEKQRVDVGVVARTIEGWEQSPFYKAQFEAQFANATPLAASAADITKAIEDTLLSLQQAFDGRVRSEMSGGSLKNDALALAGAKKLLESFVALGMPQALERDDLLRSLLYGNQALADDQQMALAYTRPISATQLTVNPRLELMATAKKRHEALGALQTRYTDAINAETYSEPISLIGDTRLRMQLALTLAGTEPTPGDNRRRLYLPLLRR